MSKKIFIITGESSGDKIASLVIKKLKEKNPEIEFLAIGGDCIKLQGISCVFDIKDIAFMGFFDVFRNIFLIKRKIQIFFFFSFYFAFYFHFSFLHFYFPFYYCNIRKILFFVSYVTICYDSVTICYGKVTILLRFCQIYSPNNIQKST